MAFTLTVARVLGCPDALPGPATVVIDSGEIRAVTPAEAAAAVEPWTLVPGFVDLQVNGIGDVDVATADGPDWARLDAHLLGAGVTSWCPTLVTAPLDVYPARLERVAAAAVRPEEGQPLIVGAHLEGPMLGGRPGAHPPAHLQPVDLAWLDSLPPVVRLVTIAPELDGVIDAIGLLRSRGIVVSLGHSAAEASQVTAAVDAGATMVTHLYNGMEPLHHRRPGLVGVGLTDERLAVGLIADLVHVDPTALALAFRAKGPGRVVLVSDAVAWQAERIGRTEIRHDGTAPRLPDGTLAGSSLTMDAAIRNIVASGAASLEAAVAAASTSPAAVLGLDDRGLVAPGRRADLVALDGDLEVVATWVGGVRRP
ncbi:MAG TPA: amidohydrolase family protein [Acidimicrobiales bacterium]|nr:amidohydrolase family protein [Acidimicrobiales bacterium]